jgi:DNA repair exonuclease SbcCD ATPase subunit
VSAPTYQPQPQRSGLTTALVAGAIIVLFVANIYLYVQINNLRTDLASAQDALKTQSAQLGSLRESSSVSAAAQAQHVEALKQDLEATRAQARTMSSQAKAEALAHADQLTKQIEAEQAKMQAQTAAEIGNVKQAADTANSKIADVSTDVGTVKTNLASTNADLQKTIADLKSTRGDLGVQSGLIATNATDLAALRKLGERNYFEFKIGKPKKKEFTKVSDIQIRLADADPKKNRFTLDVMADDKVTQKKDKSINEPLQFYTGRATQPYEIVINQVQKNVVVGYLATPKVQTSR